MKTTQVWLAVSVRMIQLENRFDYNVNLGSVDFFS
jgi:hypothetical protein